MPCFHGSHLRRYHLLSGPCWVHYSATTGKQNGLLACFQLPDPLAMACLPIVNVTLPSQVSIVFCCAVQAAGPSRDKDWWSQKTNPSFPSAPIADSAPATSTAAPKQNPFLKGGSQEDIRVRDAPLAGDGKHRAAGDKKDPRKEFEAGLMGAVSILTYVCCH